LLVSGAKQIPVGASEGAVLAGLPEASNLEIAGQMFGVRTLGISENRVENLGCAVEFPAAWGGVDEFEGGQPTQESLVPIQVAGEPRDATMGWVAVDKSGQSRSWCASISGGNEERKSVLQGRVQAFRDVGSPWGKAGWQAQLFAEKLEFFLFGFDILKIGVRQDEVENQQPRPNEVSGVEPMISEILLAN
jgi:hypothetical protein